MRALCLFSQSAELNLNSMKIIVRNTEGLRNLLKTASFIEYQLLGIFIILDIWRIFTSTICDVSSIFIKPITKTLTKIL